MIETVPILLTIVTVWAQLSNYGIDGQNPQLRDIRVKRELYDAQIEKNWTEDSIILKSLNKRNEKHEDTQEPNFYANFMKKLRSKRQLKSYNGNFNQQVNTKTDQGAPLASYPPNSPYYSQNTDSVTNYNNGFNNNVGYGNNNYGNGNNQYGNGNNHYDNGNNNYGNRNNDGNGYYKPSNQFNSYSTTSSYENQRVNITNGKLVLPSSVEAFNRSNMYAAKDMDKYIMPRYNITSQRSNVNVYDKGGIQSISNTQTYTNQGHVYTTPIPYHNHINTNINNNNQGNNNYYQNVHRNTNITPYKNQNIMNGNYNVYNQRNGTYAQWNANRNISTNIPPLYNPFAHSNNNNQTSILNYINGYNTTSNWNYSGINNYNINNNVGNGNHNIGNGVNNINRTGNALFNKNKKNDTTLIANVIGMAGCPEFLKSVTLFGTKMCVDPNDYDY